jgi:hypothetical protein
MMILNPLCTSLADSSHADVIHVLSNSCEICHLFRKLALVPLQADSFSAAEKSSSGYASCQNVFVATLVRSWMLFQDTISSFWVWPQFSWEFLSLLYIPQFHHLTIVVLKKSWCIQHYQQPLSQVVAHSHFAHI